LFHNRTADVVDKTSVSNTEPKEFLQLYSASCKTCNHLDPQETKRYSSCHYTKGNKHCPASEIQIVVVGKAYRYAHLVLAARNKRDPKAEGRILSIVSKQSPAFQERFYAALENPSEIIE
jgi:hypothetical protein